MKKYLRHNIDDWAKIISKWTESCEIRQKEIKSKCNLSAIEVIRDWIVLSNPKGCQLVEIDFEYLHPRKSCIIFEKWESFVIHVQEYFEINVTKTEPLLKDLKTAQLKDGNYYVIFILNDKRKCLYFFFNHNRFS